MARQKEIALIRPRRAIDALGGFNDDVNFLLAAARNAHSFLLDDSLDPDKTRKAVAPILSEGIERVRKWYEAD